MALSGFSWKLTWGMKRSKIHTYLCRYLPGCTISSWHIWGGAEVYRGEDFPDQKFFIERERYSSLTAFGSISTSARLQQNACQLIHKTNLKT